MEGDSASWPTKRRRWTAAEVASRYDHARFGGLLGALKARHDRRRVLRLLSRCGSGLRVLDLPTGTGRLVAPLCRAGHRVVGLDLSPAMLRAGQHRAGNRFLGRACAEAEHLPLRDGACDAVVSLRFLFHIEDASARRAIFEELARVARWLVGQVALAEGRRARRRRDRGRRGFTSAELAEELAACGFTLVELQPLAPLFSDKGLFLARSERSS